MGLTACCFRDAAIVWPGSQETAAGGALLAVLKDGLRKTERSGTIALVALQVCVEGVFHVLFAVHAVQELRVACGYRVGAALPPDLMRVISKKSERMVSVRYSRIAF